MTSFTREELRLAQHLAGFASEDHPNRAALAALRRGLGKEPGEVPQMFPYVVPVLEGVPLRDEWAYFLVASLFGMYPGPFTRDGNRDNHNLGASFRAVSDLTGSGSIEGRFVALLNARRDDLPEHLRFAVALCESARSRVDWAQLLHDVLAWDSASRRTQREWARSFWAGRESIASDGTDDSTSERKEV